MTAEIYQGKWFLAQHTLVIQNVSVKFYRYFTKVSSHGRLVYGYFGSLKGSSFETKPIIKNTEHI